MSVGEHDVLNLYTILKDPEFRDVAITLIESGASNVTDTILMLFLVFDRFFRVKPLFQRYYRVIPAMDDASAHNLLLAPPEVVSFLELPAIEKAVEELSRKLFETFQWCSVHVFPKVRFIISVVCLCLRNFFG